MRRRQTFFLEKDGRGTYTLGMHRSIFLIKKVKKLAYNGKPTQSLTKANKMQTCTGCLDDQPNQLAHMFPGGCLYMEDDSEPEQVQAEQPQEQCAHQKIELEQPASEVQDGSGNSVQVPQQQELPSVQE